MFTSKKAQYLNKDFDRISPITNIDSLYYEQAEKDGNTSYIIKRRAVAKYMPIKFDISNFLISSINVLNSSNPITGEVSLGPTFKNISTNINYIKSEILNPSDSITHELLYDTSLYTIDSSKNINIQDLLQYYTNVHYFDTSINSIVNQINIINSSIPNVSNYVNNTSILANILIGVLNGHTEYYNNVDSIDGSNNGIYNLIYYPNNGTDTSFIVKVQCISTNQFKNYISLDSALPLSDDTSYINQWDFHYDINSSKITYLKDEYGNEGNFDFRNIKLANGNFIGLNNDRNTTKNNYIYIDPVNSSILFDEDSVAENCIINSTNILFLDDVYNNYIVNSGFNNLQMQYAKNNKCSNIISSSLNITRGNNNILINCENCSIKIAGNNNTLINVKNLNVSLGNNNIIVGDEIGCQPTTSILENMKLFFNYSTSTALSTDHTSSYTFYGGFGNDVSVYVGSLRTTNKY